MNEKELFREIHACLRHSSGFLQHTFLLNTPENLCISTGLPFALLEDIRGALYL
jgi:hypothetical protein